MPLRDSAEFPEGLLNPGTQRFEGFGKTERDAFHIAVRQHAVKECVLKSLSGNLHPQFVADREVAGRQPTGMMFLIEEHGLPGTMQTPPLC